MTCTLIGFVPAPEWVLMIGCEALAPRECQSPARLSELLCEAVDGDRIWLEYIIMMTLHRKEQNQGTGSTVCLITCLDKWLLVCMMEYVYALWNAFRFPIFKRNDGQSDNNKTQVLIINVILWGWSRAEGCWLKHLEVHRWNVNVTSTRSNQIKCKRCQILGSSLTENWDYVWIETWSVTEKKQTCSANLFLVNKCLKLLSQEKVAPPTKGYESDSKPRSKKKKAV